MKIIISGQDHEITAENFTILAYTEHPDRPWSGLNGDASVRLEESPGGAIKVTVQSKPAGPNRETQVMAVFTIWPWKD